MYKLCNNDTVLKQGEDKSDPTYNFDIMCKVITNDVDNITKHA